MNKETAMYSLNLTEKHEIKHKVDMLLGMA